MNIFRTVSIWFLAALFFIAELSFGQKQTLRSFHINQQTGSPSTLPPSNSVSHINIEHDTIWIGTSKGVGKSATGGRSWTNFLGDPAFTREGIFAIATNNDTVWAATGYDQELDEGSVQTGTGYAFTTNSGTTWNHVDQTIDQRSDSILSYGINDSLWMLPVVVPEQNVTFDIALSPGTVWIASWASGLRKSTDNGTSWQRVLLPSDNRSSIKPTDTLWTYAPNDSLHLKRIYERFDPRRNNNFLAFAVYAIDQDTIWCGTAGGINKSTDGGISWTRFTHKNQSSPILGNWVIAIDEQKFNGISRIWTTNWKAEDQSEEFGVSYSDDGGRIWTNLLHGVRAYDFAFKDSIAYIATDEGLFRTADGGNNFTRITSISDPSVRQLITSSSFFSVAVLGDTILAGTGDGLVSTIDNDTHPFGKEWNIYRTYQSVGTATDSYAYPNPFSPLFEPVRIHYGSSASTNDRTVSVEIFDFGMNRVRTLVNGALRSGNLEHDEIWDGRKDNGDIVANGIYIYRISIDSEEPRYGKILVLQ
jgi:hypothetical protein